ncbi:glycosyltransferase family 4 protein [Pandoraea anhela]|uniref:GalNAc-alpha-(1->4)-GalNAc-alpha-(1->3)-diNAcBac-PP-undecaprenol alpha-1,4-N-acetyl-D-galactosaminyltransferase n=1 Tax=Pandoraea anhela TaxID=2508295 RepID=A0A5E4XQY8_9BURK|nr:glycosyltransferase family 4 protein [Pandoraea anhela]VVE38673.1 GalNAc-alpha-(1->4)-GalNAc-alpha-(1->3)-diNAcBac-PP-undecaprenol alpha-1,4-N-acetyl-D-galactosaminyltransferase [Pandoraea anhela]
MTTIDSRTSPGGARTLCLFTGTLAAFAGAERATATLANALAARGHRVHVLSLWGHAPVFPLSPDVVHHAMFEARVAFKRHYPSIVCQFRRYVLEHGIEVMVDVDPMLALYTVPATLGLAVRRIAWEHSTYASDLGRRARRWARALAARRYDAVVVLTDADRKAWQTHHPHARAQFVTLPNPLGIPMPDIAPEHADERCILAVGRLVPEKGFDRLIDAWSRIAHDAPGWRVRIVGDGPLRDALIAQARSAGVADSVQVLPAVAEIAQHYAQASIYCLPSRRESFGLVLIETQAYAVPIVAFAADAGPRALLHHGIDSLVVNDGDIAALAEALRRLIGDAPLRRQLGRAGYAHAQHFRADAIAARWEALWETR